MPTVSFYLRNEDYDKWRALEKPGEFIHNALNGVGEKRGFGVADVIALAESKHPWDEGKPIKTPHDAYLKEMGKAIKAGEIIKSPKDAEKATGWAGSNFKKHNSK